MKKTLLKKYYSAAIVPKVDVNNNEVKEFKYENEKPEPWEEQRVYNDNSDWFDKNFYLIQIEDKIIE